jgi:V/A-type H+-transporting ATPase subunit C
MTDRPRLHLDRDFFVFPEVGADDWRYAYAAAKVRALETQMLDRPVLADIAAAPDLDSAVRILAPTEYSLGHDARDAERTERTLLERRSAVRNLFSSLVESSDNTVVELFKSRADFTNIRLAARRIAAQRPSGGGYSDEGTLSADGLMSILEQEDYDLLPLHMRQSLEAAVLAYYKDRDIRRIDYAVDSYENDYRLETASGLGNVFLCGLFMIEADLTNIRTMLRLRLSESRPDVFLDGGFVEVELFRNALEAPAEATASFFFATPYHRIVESSVGYMASNRSFLRAECLCREHVDGFLASTARVTAGIQPLIAFLLRKENEIRMIRGLLSAKRYGLGVQLVRDWAGC